MNEPVLQIVPLGMPWPTIDPFLFCVHHVDAYPPGNGRFGPDAPLAGRELGSDFAGLDGWRMYHGCEVPGFPQHPHRGFETVTYVRQGLIDHSDSLGAAARFGRGDVQWLTAGAGIVHAEMFPLHDIEGPNPVELFQIWVNLPSSDKMAAPHFTMLWDEHMPRRCVVAADRAEPPMVEVTVIAGKLVDADGALDPLAPPPASWASHLDADVAIWHVHLEAGGSWQLPPAASGATVRSLYVFGDGDLTIGGQSVPTGHVAAILPMATPVLASRTGTEVLMLQGRPIGEPVAQYGPFVMNDRAGVERAMSDYRQTQFGGWPWPTDGPVHGELAATSCGRFAHHPDGRLDLPASERPASTRRRAAAEDAR